MGCAAVPWGLGGMRFVWGASGGAWLVGPGRTGGRRLRAGPRNGSPGPARVSSREQNLDRQLAALAEFGVAEGDVFADKASGKDFEQHAWRQLRDSLEPGDVLAVKSIDRLGRD